MLSLYYTKKDFLQIFTKKLWKGEFKIMKNMSILNKIFTRNVLRDVVSARENANLNYIVQQYELNNKSYGDLFKQIYDVLKKSYRNEYYYKNTLLNKLLLGVHSVNTTTALTELPIANSKADFLMINGKAVVYEIKTELDNLERLESQINDYYLAFDHVAVVTYEDNLEAIEKLIANLRKPVGIYYIKKNGAISTVKKPEAYRNRLSKETIFSILRKEEYQSILMNYFGSLPKTNSFNHYSECKKEFLKIPIDYIYSNFLKLLKKRVKVTKNEFSKVPIELKFLVYFLNFSQEDFKNLDFYLKQKCGGV